MRKLLILLAAVMLALCFAIPAMAAGPPGEPLAFEAPSLSVGTYTPADAAIAKEPAIVAAPRLESSAILVEAVVASALVLGCYCVAAMLAGLMRGVASNYYAKFARDIRLRANTFGLSRSRGWVYPLRIAKC